MNTLAPVAAAELPSASPPPLLLAALDGAPFAALLVDAAGRILFANPPLLTMFGYPMADLLQQSVEILLPENERNAHARQRQEKVRHHRTGAMGRGLNTAGLRRDGTIFALDIRLQSVDVDGQRFNIAFVAERQNQPGNQRELERLNRLLRLIHDCNAILVRARDSHALITGIAQSMASIGRYPLVWIGLLPFAASGAFQKGACTGHQHECTDCCLPAPYERLARLAVAARVPLRLNAAELQAQAEESLCPVLSAIPPPALVALPLLTAETDFGCLCVTSTEEDAFSGHEIELLQELADDLAFGLEAAQGRALRQKAENRLRLLERAVEASVNAIVITDAQDAQHPILYVNPAFERMTGYPAAEALGCNARFLVKDDWNQEALDEIRCALRERREAQALLRNYRKDGRLFWNELTVAPVRDAQGKVTHFVSLMNDFTERKLQEDLIERHSHYDALTGLPNRHALFGRIEQACMTIQAQGNALGVVLIALDRFSLVNDAYGHDAGDALLRAVGVRLLGVVRTRDTVARLGGDEFVVVLAQLDLEHAITVVDKIRNALVEPFELACGEVLISASIGVSFSPRDGLDAQTLIRNAEVAMLGAKTAGWNAVRYYAEDMNRRTGERLEMEFDLRRALERGDFEVFYQPIIAIDSGRIVEAEALLRWNRPQHGLVAPDSFIPLAETSGLIVPLGRWVLHEACRQNAAWRSAGLTPITLAVNLSARQFREPGLEAWVAEALAEHGLDGGDLTLEITESLLMTSIDAASDTLLRLKALGVHISLDDFGTGYSSLAYLKRLPLDALKIDRSFVRDISTDPNDAAITTTIISMARALHLGVIAEGVESREQLEHLRSNGCQRAQGYLFSRPLPAAQFEKLLARGFKQVVESADSFSP